MTDMDTLGNQVRFQSGGTPSRDVPEYYLGDVPWITGADINNTGVIVPRFFITDKAIQRSAANLVPRGTVLLVTRTSVGKVAITDREMCFSQDITALTPNSRLHPRYLAHFLRSRQRVLASSARGATIKGVTREVVSALKVPLPSADTQLQIADALDQVDALRAKRREAISMLDDLAESIFLKMFGAPQNSWKMVTVAGVASAERGAIRTGPFGSQLLHEEFVDSGISVLGIDNAVHNEFRWQGRRYITYEKFKKLSRYTVRPGDVLITIMGTCGRCAIVPDDIPTAINTKHLCCITLDQRKCLPEFLHSYFLMHPEAQRYLRRSAKGAVMDGLNMGIIKKLPIALAPLSVQQVYVDRIRAIKAAKAAHQAHLAELDALFASVQYRAFRGELFEPVLS